MGCGLLFMGPCPINVYKYDKYHIRYRTPGLHAQNPIGIEIFTSTVNRLVSLYYHLGLSNNVSRGAQNSSYSQNK
jgi:hypothetical protein